MIIFVCYWLVIDDEGGVFGNDWKGIVMCGVGGVVVDVGEGFVFDVGEG